jgi:alkyl hydroperoxide reductase subunit AhpF
MPTHKPKPSAIAAPLNGAPPSSATAIATVAPTPTASGVQAISPPIPLHDVIVIGSGPAGMSAALYAARANLDTKVIVGPQLGGQVSITYEIDNYLGFHSDLSGEELTQKMVS